MTLTSRSDEHTTSMEEYTVTAISGSEFTAKLKFTMTIDGNEVFSKEDNVRYVKQTADYMNWTALRQNADGTTFTATFEMEKVE